MDAPSLLASVTALRTTSAIDAIAAAAAPLIAALGRGGSPAMAALTMSLTSRTGTIALDVDADWWEGSDARGGGGAEGTVNGGGRRIVAVSDEDGSFSLSSFCSIPPSTTSSLIRSEPPRGWKTDWNWWDAGSGASQDGGASHLDARAVDLYSLSLDMLSVDEDVDAWDRFGPGTGTGERCVSARRMKRPRGNS